VHKRGRQAGIRHGRGQGTGAPKTARRRGRSGPELRAQLRGTVHSWAHGRVWEVQRRRRICRRCGLLAATADWNVSSRLRTRGWLYCRLHGLYSRDAARQAAQLSASWLRRIGCSTWRVDGQRAGCSALQSIRKKGLYEVDSELRRLLLHRQKRSKARENSTVI